MVSRLAPNGIRPVTSASSPIYSSPSPSTLSLHTQAKNAAFEGDAARTVVVELAKRSINLDMNTQASRSRPLMALSAAVIRVVQGLQVRGGKGVVWG